MKKGFTLIELLAVIIILAIVALIAVPIILNVVNDARISAGKSEANMIYSGISNYCVTSAMEHELKGTEDICADGVTVDEVKDMVNLGNATVNKVTYENGKVTELEVESNNHIFKLCSNGTFVMDDEVCGSDNIGQLGDTSIKNIAEALVYENGTCKSDGSTYQYMGGCYLKGISNMSGIEFIDFLVEQFLKVDKQQFLDENGNYVAEKLEDWAEQYLIEKGGQEALEMYTQLGFTPFGVLISEIASNLSLSASDVIALPKIDNNYVWYSGFLWKIMGINADGSIKMIASEPVTEIPYHESSSNWDSSYAQDWLNNYFYPRLKGNDIIVSQTWCSMNGMESFESINDIPTCSNNMSSGTYFVGLRTFNENWLSGGTLSYINFVPFEASMVFDDRTMSPYSDSYTYFGGGMSSSPVNSAYGLVPVINVYSSVKIYGGNGTLEANSAWTSKTGPYILNEDKSIEVTGSLNENSTSGEYVLFAGKKYRIVDKDSGGNVKLILDDYYKEDGNIFKMEYNETSAGVFSTTEGIGQKLNNDVLEWLVPTSDTANRNKLVTDYTWFQKEFNYGNNYTVSLDEENPTRAINATVGLIRVGEMLSGMSTSMITEGYNEIGIDRGIYFEEYWTMTSSTNSAWIIEDYARSATDSNAIRPVIVIKSDVEIISGNGTWSNPYEI